MFAAQSVLHKSYAALDHLISCGVDPAKVRVRLMNDEEWRAARLLTSTGRVREMAPFPPLPSALGASPTFRLDQSPPVHLPGLCARGYAQFIISLPAVSRPRRSSADLAVIPAA
jgi:hypothetical protein